MEKYSKWTPELIERINELFRNYPQVMNLPISNGAMLVTNTERQGKKIRVSKSLSQISIRELHSD